MKIFDMLPDLIVEPYRTGSKILTRRMKLKWYTLGFRMTREARQDLVEFPRRFAIGYRDYDRDCNHYFVVPLNVIVAFGRWVWLQLIWIGPRKFLEGETVIEMNLRIAFNEMIDDRLMQTSEFYLIYEAAKRGVEVEFESSWLP
jgi:hypothetical protein